jgi:hypothetical protein
LLLCDQLHEGACLWPDGVAVALPHSGVPDATTDDDASHRAKPGVEQPAVVDADA